MNYRFQNLLGAPYRGGNAVVVNNTLLISAVGNRVSVTDLVKSETVTLPFQASTNLRRIAASPDGVFLLTVDENNRCLFINLPRRAVLHRLSFKHQVGDVKFSPNGRFIAVAAGKLLQIWRSPGFRKEFFPFELVKTFADCNDRITSLDWSPNSDYLVVGSKDLAARLFYFEESKTKKKNNNSKPFLFLGHRDVILGAFFGVDKKTNSVSKVYTLSRDGAIFSWGYPKFEPMEEEYSEPESPGTPDVRRGQNGELVNLKKRKDMEHDTNDSDEDIGPLLHNLKWELLKKDFFLQAPAKLTACDYHRGLDMVVVGFSNGVFGLYQMPDFVCIHLLSISREKITTAVFNGLGNWLTFGCAKLGQLLVWEWKSESYILKQQGHYFDVNCIAYSPDSQLLATGADDNKIKVWTVSSGFCFVTFSEHTNSVTALHFMANNHCLLSASLDGTVRAWDLFRYRNFRTFVTPTPKQFVSLASDQSGEVICAGTLDSFEIFVWSMKTGRLLDVLSGHEGPVHGLMFSPTNAILASSSWDKTVRLWDIFEGRGGVEKFDHTHDVLTLAYRPDGKQLACSTLDGQIHFWDPLEGVEMYTIEGRRDISGGRLMTDRRLAANSSAGKCFTTLCYSADGSYILAGGSSKYICMYDVAEQVLLRRFQITLNLSLDGVLDFLNSKKMTEAGPLDLIDDDDSDTEEGIDKQTRNKLAYDLPGSMPNHGRPIIRTKCLRIAPTGRSWAAATTEGVLLYSMDESFIFDPTDLDVDVTPEAVDAALKDEQPKRALILSLRMNEDALIKKCIVAVAPAEIPAVAASVPFRYLQRLVEALAALLEKSPHLEFILRWCQELCKVHGSSIQQNSRNLLPALKSLQKVITRLHQDLADTCSSNEYMLRYLCSTSNKR
ncbi:periodic tryptophan protein 2 [Andrographis paniculata]|uniref:periodic tryptophan protein 2 n=1 Tax=Andrographis paniculata TaxID=175694 RepID=UPI0021E90A3D|nr:periodic tryptophan protein 2 [Andrographis paniculata]XP_051135827.1 periodic tryptophan protein 2 [Andrographis paniculata]XP_051135828.1 periodic tryptophan protein 2 [Andrographis paniculata]